MELPWPEIRQEPPDWSGRDDIIPASIERKANSVRTPTLASNDKEKDAMARRVQRSRGICLLLNRNARFFRLAVSASVFTYTHSYGVRDDSPSKLYLSSSSGKTASVGGNNGGGGKVRPLASGTEGDGWISTQSNQIRTIVPDGASQLSSLGDIKGGRVSIRAREQRSGVESMEFNRRGSF
ncbi:hypothetical protein OIU74_008715 [Salix koriyanagi]|uniref:Uncharacterized protein n=1 Tax=Salix koriyanagi TaxID=2511006 RepID=A0A9Q0TQM0_9ROSI|nr:hypothetical protein OIU74_008715 [Salix koriyanagi]